jgi:hypothetical protein
MNISRGGTRTMTRTRYASGEFVGARSLDFVLGHLRLTMSCVSMDNDTKTTSIHDEMLVSKLEQVN